MIKTPTNIWTEDVEDFSKDNRWRSAEQKLQKAYFMNDDWDGEGAKAPDPRVVSTAIALLRRLRESGGTPAPTRVSFSQNRTILLAWKEQTQHADYAEAEIEGPGDVAWMIVKNGQAVHRKETIAAENRKQRHTTSDQFEDNSLLGWGSSLALA